MATSPAEVLWTARYDYRPHSRLENHKHKYFQIICVRSGEGCFWLGQEIPLVPRRVFLIKPGQMHGLRALTEVRTLDLKFVVRDASLKRALLAAPAFIEEQRSVISELADRVRSEGERRGIFFRELCAAYLVQLLVAYLAESRGKSEGERPLVAEDAAVMKSCDLVRRAMDYISQHYAEDLDEQGLARSLGASDRQLRHRFKESLEISPMQYLAFYRVEKAEEMIKDTDLALKVIAEQSGFKSIHHFNRVFAKITGQPPGAWRRQHREGICKDVCIDPNFSNVILVRQEDEELAKPSS